MSQNDQEEKAGAIGDLPVPKDATQAYLAAEEYYPFNRKQIEFLREYQKDLDEVRALKDVGYSRRHWERFTDHSTKLGQAMTREIEAIQKEWIGAIRLNSASSASKHLEIFNKIESDYDAGDLDQKAKFASTLAKLSDTSLKATGHYGREQTGGGVKVEINIDLGEKDAPKDIEVEVLDEQ